MAERYPFALAPFKFEGGRVPMDADAPVERTAELDDRIRLSSGRSFYAHGLVVGIGADGSVSEGWDGIIQIDLTPEERRDLAQMMIERWKKFGGV